MKYKKILIATILLLAILTVGAVSASEDADVLAQDSDILAQDADVLAGDSDVLAQDADVLAEDSDEIVSQDNAIDDEITSSGDDEFEGNFTFSMDPISTTSGQTFATLNIQEATDGIILVTTDNDDLLFEKYLGANDFYQSSEGYSYNILARDVDFSNFDKGKYFLNFRFYDSDHNQVIHEYYQVDYNKNNNILAMAPAIYLEINDGMLTYDTADPAIVVYAQIAQLSKYEFSIVADDFSWGYYPGDLTRLTLSNGGLYTKNHVEGWAYYGISAARLMNSDDFGNNLDGKTLHIYVKILQGGYGADIMAEEERTIIFEYGGGFYLDDDVVYPTLVLEVYGTEYLKISYDNGEVFAVIVSGDERTGKWLPVDKLIPVGVRVLSDDGEIEFLNVTLGSLDYTVVPESLGIIEHFFTLSDLNNFTGLNDGDIIRFALTVPPYPESYMYYTIHFDEDGIILTYGTGNDKAYFNVNDKVFKDEQYEQVFGIDVTQDNLNNELGSGIVEVTSDDGQVLFTSDELYEMYFVDDGDGRLIHWFTLGELNYFRNLEDGDIVYFTLWQYDGAVEPWIQKRYRVTFDNTYIYLEECGDDGVNSTISAVYDAGASELVATLTNAETGDAIVGADIEFSFADMNCTAKTDSNGIATVPADLLSGTYTATITYNGNNEYKPSSASVKFTVKATSSISVVYDKSAKIVVATLVNTETGKTINGANIVIKLSGVSYALKTDSNGQANVSTKSLAPGTYSAAVSYKGNSKYKSSSASIDFAIEKTSSAISVVYDNNAKTVVATLINNETGNTINGANIVIKLDGVSYALKTDSKGQATVSTKDLSPGVYSATVSYKGNSKYKSSSATVSFTNKRTTSVSAVYNSATNEIVATLINDANKAMGGANVVITLNDVKTTLKADANGQVKLSLGDANPNSFTATVTYNGNSKYLGSSFTIKSAQNKVTSAISTAYNKETGEIVSTLVNTKTGKVMAGANVIINVNGQNYAVKTDANGQAKLSTEGMNDSVYKVTSTYNGNSKYVGTRAISYLVTY